jgi:hypothetical protein
VTENLFVAYLAKGDLTPVTVSKQIFHGVEACSKEAICFPQFCAFVSTSTTSSLNATTERSPNKRGRSIPSLILCRYVFLGERTSTTVLLARSGILITFMPVCSSISSSRDETGGRSFGWNERASPSFSA